MESANKYGTIQKNYVQASNEKMNLTEESFLEMD